MPGKLAPVNPNAARFIFSRASPARASTVGNRPVSARQRAPRALSTCCSSVVTPRLYLSARAIASESVSGTVSAVAGCGGTLPKNDPCGAAGREDGIAIPPPDGNPCAAAAPPPSRNSAAASPSRCLMPKSPSGWIHQEPDPDHNSAAASRPAVAVEHSLNVKSSEAPSMGHHIGASMVPRLPHDQQQR